MTRILDSRGVVLDDWSPLDGVPAPEWIPPVWIGPHAGHRLVQALQVLARLPIPNPASQGTAWPAYAHDWEDLLAQCEADDQTRALDVREQNKTRILPTAIEIMHMEESIAWPARYLAWFPQLLVTVGIVALWRSRHRDIEFIARHKLRLPFHLVRLWNRQGLDIIAGGLRRDQVEVF